VTDPGVSGYSKSAYPGISLLPPSERVRAFAGRVAIPVLSFVGKKKSGKTTVLRGVVRELSARELDVAVLKHDAHGFEIDTPGTDSFKLKAAGARVAVLSSPTKYAVIASPQKAAPKIEMSRRARSTALICPKNELIAIVADQTFADQDVFQLGLDDIIAICDLIEERIVRH